MVKWGCVIILCTVSLWGKSWSITDEDIRFFLGRTTAGVQQADKLQFKKLGLKGYLEWQFSDPIEPNPLLETFLDHSTYGRWNEAQILAFLREKRGMSDDEKKEFRKAMTAMGDEAQAIKLYRSVYSSAQLAERMDDFWFNHFNIFIKKGTIGAWMGRYDRDAIRPFVFGRFRDLLGAVSKHPAMLIYLDNQDNLKPNPQTHKGLNENFARELMELHTLGIGHYSQDDVQALAKILTGWRSDPKVGFRFDPAQHDTSAKHFLGVDFPAGGGIEEGEKALDLLASSPDTARHIATKLLTFFMSDTPPKHFVDHLTHVYLQKEGSLRAVVEAMLTSQEFWDPSTRQRRFSSPYHYVTSVLRATELNVSDPKPFLREIEGMGMPLYGRLTPDGYPLVSSYWMSPTAMEQRIGFATRLGLYRMEGCDGKCIPDWSIITKNLPPLSSTLTQTLPMVAPRYHLPLVIGSELFMWE